MLTPAFLPPELLARLEEARKNVEQQLAQRPPVDRKAARKTDKREASERGRNNGTGWTKSGGKK